MKAISRTNINQLLDKGLNYPFVLLVAPAGSGKSTSLDLWINKLSSHSYLGHFIRLQAEQKFNEGDALFQQIVKSLSQIETLWEAPFFKLFKTDQEVDSHALIEILSQGFQQITAPLTLIIDDFHLIHSTRVMAILNHLITNLPANITLILSSRTYPDLSISKFKLNEQILIIDGNDLKLDHKELKQLNELMCDSKLDDTQLGILLEQTEGWFVGIKLALLAYAKDGDKALQAFSGNQPELLNYFAHEVISKLLPEYKELVLSLSICSSFNQTLCNELNPGTNIIHLDELSQHELLITPELETANWFRFHPLLQTFLLKNLELEKGADAIQALHFKAAHCLLTQKETSQAMYHARRCGDHNFYLNSLSAATDAWLKQGEFDPIIDAFNEISDEELTLQPSLHIKLIYALTFSRRFNQASFRLEKLKQQNLNQADIDTTRFLRFLMVMFQSDAELQHMDLPKKRTNPETPTDVIGFYLVIEAYNHMYNGELNEAFKLASKAKDVLSSIEHQFFLSYANLIIILCDRYLGRGIKAIELMYKEYAPVKHGRKNLVWVNIASGMVVMDYEQNRLSQSLQLGEQLIPYVIQLSTTEVIVNAYLYSARISHIAGNKNKAKRFLDQLERILSLGDYQRFNSQVIHEKMRQAIHEADYHASDVLCQHHKLNTINAGNIWSKSGIYEEHRERLALAYVYALKAKGNFEKARELLTEILTVLDRQQLPSRALIARCNMAMIAFRQNNLEDALRQLKKLVERYGLICFSRTIFDEAPGLEKLFQYAKEQSAFPVPSLFYEIFASLFDHQNKQTEILHPIQYLTQKELAIFELLAEGLSNSEISKQSGIALSTTKWHLKNIYQKLGVDSRASALLLAHKGASLV